MSKVLLHCCCAPCSAAIIEWMLNNETRYAERLKLTVIDGDYDYQAWKDWACHNLNTTNLEDFPERGSRCLECFKLRLLEAAKKCKELGLEQFTTTLASSRWKSLDQINAAGQWAAEMVNGEGLMVNGEKPTVTFWDKNWRKGGLQDRRNALLKENNFYNQQYCGCEYSMRKDNE